MVVKPKTNIARCFSCEVSGNVISFVQKYEKQINNIDLPTNECIAKVVDICNLNIDVSHLKRKAYNNQYTVAGKKYTTREQELIKVNEYLSKLFHYNLTAIDKEPLNYLHGRNVDDKQIKELNIGFSEKGQLLKIAEKNDKIKKEDLIELGYLRFDNYGNLQETFPDRIVFPIHDEKGNIVSFAGRGINGELPKYLHTSENSLFKKSRLLYNYANARPLAYNTEIILVEGFLDAVGARRLGFENVAATMGVAITPEHLKLIKRNNSSITLALDNDTAGHDAMIRQIPELMKQGYKINVMDISKLGDYKDFGKLSELDLPFMDIQKTKISGFNYLLDHKYFKDIEINVENIFSVYKTLKTDKLIINTYDESLFKEYLLNKTDYNMKQIDEIIYPKKIEQKENAIDNFAFKAMTNFLYTELLLQVDMKNDKVLSLYFNNNKDKIQKELVTIFNKNPDNYLESGSSTLNRENLLSDFLKDNKDYSDYESLNRFKYLNVFDQTYIKNSNGSAKVKLKDSQMKLVIKQFEDSLTDKDKLALEEVEELYIINSLDDIDGILSYKNKSLDILKENIKERLFLNKNKMDFFKFGSLFLNVDKDFIDEKFKGKTGNFKTILFYNNLDNNLTLDKSNIVTNNEKSKEETIVTKEIMETEKQEDYLFSINQVLLIPSLETETHYFVRIPNTEAKEYFYVPKEECEWTDNHDLFYTRLKYGQNYKIYDKKGEYLYDKTFQELKHKWEDKTKKQSTPSNELVSEERQESDNSFIYDNTYTSKYKEPISKIYKSKIYLETDTGFYIRTNNPKTLLFAPKKMCNWTEDKSYLIISPKKGLFNSGISKYSLEGFKKTYEKKIAYNELEQYIKLFYPNDLKKKEVISIDVPKYKCKFNSNFIEIPLVVDDIHGYINVNIIKTKINKESVIVEFSKNEQVGFHDRTGKYIDHFNGNKICDSYKEMLLDNKIIEFPNPEKEGYDIPILEKEAA